MLNFLYLIVLFLFFAILFVSTYKFFRYKRWSLAIPSLIFFLGSLFLTLLFNFTRLYEEELESLIKSFTDFNWFGIVVSILQIALIFISIICYLNVIKIERESRL